MQMPREIADQENIVRCVFSPYHYSVGKKKLKWEAFRPQPGTDLVSVIRADQVGSDVCKQHAKRMADPAEEKIYRGLAVIQAASIRSTGADIVDAPGDFEGHAHIKHGIVTNPFEALAPQESEKLRDQCRGMLRQTTFYHDPEPDQLTWTGPPLQSNPP